jgi:hypothetical protein
MQRTLVWPWHGRLQNGSLVLPNGEQRQYAGLSTSVTAAFGPGDNHRIVVPGIEPLSPEEIARAPAGGEYWAGRALVTAGILYNQQIGWIYQAKDGSRWAVNFGNRAISAGSSTFSLTFTRFGEFGSSAETFTRSFSAPIGQLSVKDRAKFSVELGGQSNVTMRLHAVSDTGQNVVLAWMAYNNEGQASIDSMPRAYAFLKLSLDGSGEGLLVTQDLLYGPDQVRVDGDYPNQSYYSIESAGSTMIEKDREPILDENGAEVGHTVTYEYSTEVTLKSQPNAGLYFFPGPVEFTRLQSWIVAVGFVGEEPVPCTLKCSLSASRSMVSLNLVTDTDQIQREFNTGHIDIVQPGAGHIAGGGSSGGSLNVSWESAGTTWAKSITFSTVSQVENDTVTNLQIFDGEENTYPNQGYGSVGFLGDGSLWTDEANKVLVSSGLGISIRQWKFDFYSNNLLGLSYRKNTEAYQFIGGLTIDGLVAQAGAYPSAVRNYGSYHPFSQQLVIGSSTPVNWV